MFYPISGETLDIWTISENDIPRQESHDQKEHYFLNEN